jgi:uncharacterized protein
MSEAAAPAIEPGLAAREAALSARLRGLGSVVVAYSGGVDSACLAWVAHRELGDRALAVTADSPSYPARHREMAAAIARDFSLRHEVIHTGELSSPAYRANDVDRCYHCKYELFTHLSALARARGFAAVVDGNNRDDRGDYRPGRVAARRFGVVSPLDDAGLSKSDVRALARAGGLPCWDEPASACLSSRIPYQSEVTGAKLRVIEAAEEAVRALGFRVVRVRHHGELARIEIGAAELARAAAPDVAAAMDRALRGLGFRTVTIDPRGYRPGSLNEGLTLRPV